MLVYSVEMSLRETIELWKNGVKKAEDNQPADAIKLFLDISEPGARIYFNVANMYISLGNSIEAEKVRLTISNTPSFLHP